MQYDFYSWYYLSLSFMHWVTLVKPSLGFEPGPQLDGQTTYQLSYPSPINSYPTNTEQRLDMNTFYKH